MSTKSKPDATEVAERCPLCGSDRLLNDPHDDGSLDAYLCFSCGSEWRNVRKADMQASEPAALPVEPLIAELQRLSYRLESAQTHGISTLAAQCVDALRRAADALAAASEREARLTARLAIVNDLAKQAAELMQLGTAQKNARILELVKDVAVLAIEGDQFRRLNEAAQEAFNVTMNRAEAAEKRADAAEQALREVRAEREKECWCPCRCWCDGSETCPVNASGLCPDCEQGRHEIPPIGVQGFALQMRLHREILDQFNAALAGSAPPGQAEGE